MKKFVSVILCLALVFGLTGTAFADTERPQKEKNDGLRSVTVYYELQNVREIGVEGRGSWKIGPKATGSSGGSVSKIITDSFGVQTIGNIGVSNNVFQSAFGVGKDKSKTLSSNCVANVKPGKTIQVYYRPLCKVSSADQVQYRIGTGVPKQEIGRTKIIVYEPVDLEFKW